MYKPDEHGPYTGNDGNRYISDYNFDPLNDLNAMHEAEKVLNYKPVPEFDKQLHKVMHLFDWQKGGSNCANYAWHATAAQRAEAFLKCLGLWKEEPKSETTVEGLR